MKHLFKGKNQWLTIFIFMMLGVSTLMAQWTSPGVQLFTHGSTTNPRLQGSGAILELVENQFAPSGSANGLKFSKQGQVSPIAEAYMWYQTNFNLLCFGPDDNLNDAIFVVDADNGNVDIDGDVEVLGEIEVMSDQRLKKDVISIDNAIATVDKLNPVEYSFKTEEYSKEELPEGTQLGFLAQELAVVMPGLVSEGRAITNDAGESINVNTVNYLEIIPLLTKAIQEQQAIIDNLNSTVTALKAEVNTMKNSATAQL